MKIETGMPLDVDIEHLEFIYGEDAFGPKTEKRHLNDIRGSLSNPDVEGPEIVYAVAMDVGKKKDLKDLKKRNLLYGAMIFEKGIVGEEPVRSQGHIHAISKSCNASTCEVYEIWSGEAYIYMQEYAQEKPGRCIAVHANKGDVVIVPPGWAHCTINADVTRPMLFGAWCVRDYGFDYTGVRAHNGVAWFPKVKEGKIVFEQNSMYEHSEIELLEAVSYPQFHLKKGVPIYTQYEENPELFTFVTRPETAENMWKNYLRGDCNE